MDKSVESCSRKVFSRFEGELKEGLVKVMQSSFPPVSCFITPFIQVEGQVVKIFLQDTYACKSVIYLDGARIEGQIPDMDDITSGDLCEKQCSYDEENREYTIGFKLIGETDESEAVDCKVVFKDARIETNIYNCMPALFLNETAWDGIIELVSAIKQKSEFSIDLCNEKEKSILPLLYELDALTFLGCGEVSQMKFIELKAIIKRHNQTKLLDLIEKLEKINVDMVDEDVETVDRDIEQMDGIDGFEREEMRAWFFNIGKYNKILEKIAREFNKQKSEAVCREILEKIKQSQEGYPCETEKKISPDVLERVRKYVQKMMRKNGFAGTYPNFVKKDKVRGLRLVESYGESYFVGFGEKADFHIHCDEAYEEDTGTINIALYCGTAILHKNEMTEDVFSCMFNARGRRLLSSVFGFVSIDDESFDESDIQLAIDTAIQKVQLKKISRLARKVYDEELRLDILSIAISLVGGCIAGVAAMLVRLVSLFIDAVFETGFDDIGTKILGTNWWFIFLLGSVVFCVGSLIVSLIKRR